MPANTSRLAGLASSELLELALMVPTLAADLAMGAPCTTLQLLPNADLLDKAENSRLVVDTATVKAVEAAIVAGDEISTPDTEMMVPEENG
jgi:hypothetical protein